MPGLTPISTSRNTFVKFHDTAYDFLSATLPTLRRHEKSANIVLAHALKLVGTEAALTGCNFINESDVSSWWDQSSHSPSHMRFDETQPFWLTVWSSPSPFSQPTLDLVLSCVNWTLGDYPIFLWTPKNPSHITSQWLTPRIDLVAENLLDLVPPERVFSIFGMTLLVKTFASYWKQLTNIAVEPEPFYAASYTWCTLATFKDSEAPLPRGDYIRRANMRDLEQVAQLCKEFADDSVRPVLSSLVSAFS